MDKMSVWKGWWLVLPLLFVEAVTGMVVVPQKCDRGPPVGVQGPRSRPEGRFALQVAGNPPHYVPGDTYTVNLSGVRGATFVGFNVHLEGGGSLYPYGDALTRYSEICPGMITHTNPAQKGEVQMLWTAPSPGTGCITFRATVVEQRDLWYQDDGPLTKVFCEDSQVRDDDQPAVNPQCCACEEAKYEVTFEGLWSRHTHPKDFPSNTSWTPRFSDVIGASHTTEYRFWDYGGIASEGLKQVAERGSTRILESELKSQSQHIRTIIKARGISFPNVTGKTFAVFRVDNIHHLISLVSMIDPSPDWIVGVSGLELCLSNCTWLETKVLNLYPWDVGTDSGITYTSPDFPTEPRDHIRRITASFPNDPRSPFFDPTGEDMKPLARLYLTRQRLYEKGCPMPSPFDLEACEVGEWSDWEPCSVTCGSGKRIRQRFYKNPVRADEENCNRMLTDRETCSASISCRTYNTGMGGHDTLELLNPEGPCAVTEWSDWSGCSVDCGEGNKHRFRDFKNNKNWKKCRDLQEPPKMADESICYGENGKVCPDPEVSVAALMNRNCIADPWSDWSPCSVTCGKGQRTRERVVHGQCEGVQKVEMISCNGVLDNCRLTADKAKDALTTTNLFHDIHSESLVHTVVPGDTVTGTYGPVVACKVTTWSSWSPCSVTCGKGVKEKTRRILEHAKNGGRVCPRKLLKRKNCNPRPCSKAYEKETSYRQVEDYEDSSNSEQDLCSYSEWTTWSRCSATCGSLSFQQRTRSVNFLESTSPVSCQDRIQNRVCNVPPCRRSDPC